MRTAYFAFLLMCAMLLLGADKPHPQQQQDTKAKQQPAPVFSAYPTWQDEACYKAKDHDAADLCAQWRAAVAAEKSAEATETATEWSQVIGDSKMT